MSDTKQQPGGAVDPRLLEILVWAKDRGCIIRLVRSVRTMLALNGHTFIIEITAAAFSTWTTA